ncbi:crotonase, partial [bacterium]|nr:crotonase [bacterium]
MTGDMITAEQALAMGLVNKVVAPNELINEVKALAKKILSKGPVSVKMVKVCVNRGMQVDIDTGSAFESDAFGLCFASGETGEGMRAFIEKREPKFR